MQKRTLKPMADGKFFNCLEMYMERKKKEYIRREHRDKGGQRATCLGCESGKIKL
jgi:hypothetical protein